MRNEKIDKEHLKSLIVHMVNLYKFGEGIESFFGCENPKKIWKFGDEARDIILRYVDIPKNSKTWGAWSETLFAHALEAYYNDREDELIDALINWDSEL